MPKREVADQPTVSRPEAAALFNMGRNKFTRRWDEHYRFHIRHVPGEKGPRLLLVDVISVAFPEATQEIIYEMAYRYVKDAFAERLAAKVNRADDDDEEET